MQPSSITLSLMQVSSMMVAPQSGYGPLWAALTNGGGLRAAIQAPGGVYPYNITENDILTVLPVTAICMQRRKSAAFSPMINSCLNRMQLCKQSSLFAAGC